MSVIVSLMVSMLSCSYSVSNRFLNSSWNSVFFDPILVASTHGGLLVINVFQFDAAHNQFMVISNVDLVDKCYVCDDVWPVC